MRKRIVSLSWKYIEISIASSVCTLYVFHYNYGPHSTTAAAQNELYKRFGLDENHLKKLADVTGGRKI